MKTKCGPIFGDDGSLSSALTLSRSRPMFNNFLSHLPPPR